MIMDKLKICDLEILEDFSSTRPLSTTTREGYNDTIKRYTIFNKMTLKQLLKEAEEDENNRIRWKDRKLKKRLIDYRLYLYEN